MMKKNRSAVGFRLFMLTLLVLILLSEALLAGGPYGSRQHRKRGIMDGNLVTTEFFNYGMIANWPNQPGGVWPKGTGHSYVDGVAMIVAASAIDEDGNRIHPFSSMYREDMDRDPVTNEPLGWEPISGYSNPNQDEPALSDNDNSWPWHWPDRPASWDGYWNGYFGKGVMNADLETYFKMDDSQDTEYNYYPDSTDHLRRGIGVEVGVRGFQWNHVLAEDCIFWHYDITNISTTDYDSTVFGFLIDWGLGGTDDSSDDAGSFFTDIDLAYAWDVSGLGDTGWGPVGYTGFAFLESPGNYTDGIDNDEDGIVDESRSDGIDNDGDWDAYADRNENGVWDDNEPLNDDLGEDGIGPGANGYVGPDFGEGDGNPTPGEPDFDALDKDESDQIGLTAFLIFALHEYQLINEEENWRVMSRLIPPTGEQLLGVNLGMMFYSGTFPLAVGQVERFSMALLFGNDENDLIRNKKTVQAIYNANYNFAQPPDKPTLTAVPGDEQVVLYWDTKAEDSYDRFLQEYDFAGYRIYRSTDPSFIDTRIVTDAYGNETFRKPLAQFDKVDGRFGPHPVGVYGAHFDLGEESGLRHSFVDTDVKNGIEYYYAVVSYDYGFIEGEQLIDTLVAIDGSDSVVVRFLPYLDESGNILGIAPTECQSRIEGDVGNILSLDLNTAAVTPNAPVAGYTPAQLEGGVRHVNGGASGSLEVNILDPDLLKDGHTYNVVFEEADTYGDFLHFTSAFLLIDSTEAETLYTSPSEALGYYGPWKDGDPMLWLSDPVMRRDRAFAQDPEADTVLFWHQSEAVIEPPMIDGFSIIPHNVSIDYTENILPDIDSVYIRDFGNMNYGGDFEFYVLSNGTNISMKLPYGYEFRFHGELDIEKEITDLTGSYVDSSIAAFGTFRKLYVNFEVWNTTLDQRSDFAVYADTAVVEDAQGVPDTLMTELWILPHILFEDSLANRDRTIFGTGMHLLVHPQAIDTTITGLDTAVVRTDFPVFLPGGDAVAGYTVPTPFSTGDIFSFTVRQGTLDNQLAARELNQIAVVPNPYVATAAWEPRINYSKGRGPRKIDFIHLPLQCTIRIYTMSGYLVNTLYHNSTVEDGAESWNLVSKDGMDVAYGVYLFHVDAPGVGEHIGKFAVIK